MPTKVIVSFFSFVLLFIINSPVVSAPQVRMTFSSTLSKAPVYFSNNSQEVSLELTDVKKCLNLTATLWQLTTRLGAILEQQTVIDCSHSMLDFTQEPLRLNFKFKTPQVKSESQFKWVFTSCNKEQACDPLGRYDFSVLPSDLLEPIRVWSKKHILYVSDKSYVLQTFFDQNLIEYIESKKQIKKNEQVISLVVVTNKTDIEAASLLSIAENYPVILFHEYPSDFPIITDKTNRNMPLIEVSLPIIERLDRDASAQKMFLQLFYLLPQTIVNK